MLTLHLLGKRGSYPGPVQREHALIAGASRPLGMPGLQASQEGIVERVLGPVESPPDNLKDSMGAAWRLREKNTKVQEEQGKANCNNCDKPLLKMPDIY